MRIVIGLRIHPCDVGASEKGTSSLARSIVSGVNPRDIGTARERISSLEDDLKHIVVKRDQHCGACMHV